MNTTPFIRSVTLDDASIIRRSAEVEHERRVALVDITHHNEAELLTAPDLTAPYDLFIPCRCVRVTVYDGSYHMVDSSEMAFKIAGSMGVKKALEAAHPILLEPLMTVEVEIPAECVGAVLGDLNARRGRIVLVEASGHMETVKALVPQAEMLNYAAALNSMTGGQGSYVMEYAHYEEVPRELASRIIEEHKAERHGVAAH